MYGDVFRDTANNFGIKMCVCVYPRGRDGKGARETERFLWVKGWKEKITTGAELHHALRVLGHLPTTTAQQSVAPDSLQPALQSQAPSAPASVSG
jgi:hypothetical protein